MGKTLPLIDVGSACKSFTARRESGTPRPSSFLKSLNLKKRSTRSTSFQSIASSSLCRIPVSSESMHIGPTHEFALWPFPDAERASSRYFSFSVPSRRSRALSIFGLRIICTGLLKPIRKKLELFLGRIDGRASTGKHFYELVFDDLLFYQILDLLFALYYAKSRLGMVRPWKTESTPVRRQPGHRRCIMWCYRYVMIYTKHAFSM